MADTQPGSILARSTTGVVKRPDMLLIYGVDSVGKSTFAAGAPKPYFLQVEKGSDNLKVTRSPFINSYEMFVAVIKELVEQPHDFQTAVVDTLDFLENLIFKAICDEYKAKNIEDHSVKALGFAKGYLYAMEKWREIMALLERLREERSMNVILIAHSMIKKFEDPSTPAGYERYQLKLRSSAGADAAALWREFVDTVLFANYVTTTSDNDKRRGMGDGTRMIYTERRPSFDAKNRLGLPFSLPLDWGAYAEAAAKGEPASSSTLTEQIEAMKGQVKQTALLPKIEAGIKLAIGNPIELSKIKNRLEALIGQQG